ncbi:hypothetical protein WJX73_001373 [Symbiochloris irregularis]|uniref:Uncharacterized protein n=1 Tax=Symbiochloris irregularis TaxID=706552 RepID=A0AAW1PXY7_9CHLO
MASYGGLFSTLGYGMYPKKHTYSRQARNPGAQAGFCSAFALLQCYLYTSYSAGSSEKYMETPEAATLDLSDYSWPSADILEDIIDMFLEDYKSYGNHNLFIQILRTPLSHVLSGIQSASH